MITSTIFAKDTDQKTAERANMNVDMLNMIRLALDFKPFVLFIYNKHFVDSL